jgi:hypothetical protein
MGERHVYRLRIPVGTDAILQNRANYVVAVRRSPQLIAPLI